MHAPHKNGIVLENHLQQPLQQPLPTLSISEEEDPFMGNDEDDAIIANLDMSHWTDSASVNQRLPNPPVYEVQELSFDRDFDLDENACRELEQQVNMLLSQMPARRDTSMDLDHSASMMRPSSGIQSRESSLTPPYTNQKPVNLPATAAYRPTTPFYTSRTLNASQTEGSMQMNQLTSEIEKVRFALD